jgi:hypothetical protein
MTTEFCGFGDQNAPLRSDDMPPRPCFTKGFGTRIKPRKNRACAVPFCCPISIGLAEELARLADCGADQRPLAIIRDARSLDVRERLFRFSIVCDNVLYNTLKGAPWTERK